MRRQDSSVFVSGKSVKLNSGGYTLVYCGKHSHCPLRSIECNRGLGASNMTQNKNTSVLNQTAPAASAPTSTADDEHHLVKQKVPCDAATTLPQRLWTERYIPIALPTTALGLVEAWERWTAAQQKCSENDTKNNSDVVRYIALLGSRDTDPEKEWGWMETPGPEEGSLQWKEGLPDALLSQLQNNNTELSSLYEPQADYAASSHTSPLLESHDNDRSPKDDTVKDILVSPPVSQSGSTNERTGSRSKAGPSRSARRPQPLQLPSMRPSLSGLASGDKLQKRTSPSLYKSRISQPRGSGIQITPPRSGRLRPGMLPRLRPGLSQESRSFSRPAARHPIEREQSSIARGPPSSSKPGAQKLMIPAQSRGRRKVGDVIPSSSARGTGSPTSAIEAENEIFGALSGSDEPSQQLVTAVSTREGDALQHPIASPVGTPPSLLAQKKNRSAVQRSALSPRGPRLNPSPLVSYTKRSPTESSLSQVSGDRSSQVSQDSSVREESLRAQTRRLSGDGLTTSSDVDIPDEKKKTGVQQRKTHLIRRGNGQSDNMRRERQDSLGSGPYQDSADNKRGGKGRLKHLLQKSVPQQKGTPDAPSSRHPVTVGSLGDLHAAPEELSLRKQCSTELSQGVEKLTDISIRSNIGDTPDNQALDELKLIKTHSQAYDDHEDFPLKTLPSIKRQSIQLDSEGHVAKFANDTHPVSAFITKLDRRGSAPETSKARTDPIELDLLCREVEDVIERERANLENDEEKQNIVCEEIKGIVSDSLTQTGSETLVERQLSKDSVPLIDTAKGKLVLAVATTILPQPAETDLPSRLSVAVKEDQLAADEGTTPVKRGQDADTVEYPKEVETEANVPIEKHVSINEGTQSFTHTKRKSEETEPDKEDDTGKLKKVKTHKRRKSQDATAEENHDLLNSMEKPKRRTSSASKKPANEENDNNVEVIQDTSAKKAKRKSSNATEASTEQAKAIQSATTSRRTSGTSTQTVKSKALSSPRNDKPEPAKASGSSPSAKTSRRTSAAPKTSAVPRTSVDSRRSVASKSSAVVKKASAPKTSAVPKASAAPKTSAVPKASVAPKPSALTKKAAASRTSSASKKIGRP